MLGQRGWSSTCGQRLMLEQHTHAGATMGTDGPNSSHGDWSLWGDAYGDRSRGEVGESGGELTVKLLGVVRRRGDARARRI